MRAALALLLARARAVFPGDPHLAPLIHFAPDVVSTVGGWHDIAGAITHHGVHHIYQGTGWNHARSRDLVTWSVAPHGPAAIHETYAGMDSDTDPCSGFITKDPDDDGYDEAAAAPRARALLFRGRDPPVTREPCGPNGSPDHPLIERKEAL